MDIEKLSAKFHDIYQQEARRQGDVRHKDKYEDLSENIKEFDRVLARYVKKLLKAKDKKIKELQEALIWCSGSEDFGEGGKARKGWLKICKPLLEEKGK